MTVETDSFRYKNDRNTRQYKYIIHDKSVNIIQKNDIANIHSDNT